MMKKHIEKPVSLADQQFKPAPIVAKRSPLVGLALLITLLAVLFIVGGLSYYWVQDSKRSPVELSYCGKSINFGTPQYQCIETLTLKIPRIYFPLGGHFDYSQHKADSWHELEVAYPSMQPWHSVPLWQRWNTNKVEITITGNVTAIPDIEEVREQIRKYLSGKGVLKLSQVSGSIYGLDQYLMEPWRDGYQYFWPLDPNLRTSIDCGYRADLSGSEYEQKYGCGASTYTPWGLTLTIRHKRILLPHWADIHAKTQALIQSFIVTSDAK